MDNLPNKDEQMIELNLSVQSAKLVFDSLSTVAEKYKQALHDVRSLSDNDDVKVTVRVALMSKLEQLQDLMGVIDWLVANATTNTPVVNSDNTEAAIAVVDRLVVQDSNQPLGCTPPFDFSVST